MRRYRTEIVIPASRLVTLQLPEGLPPGRARVTVALAAEPAVAAPEMNGAAEVDVEVEVEPALDHLAAPRDDYEWWEEFGDASESDEPGSLTVRLVALES